MKILRKVYNAATSVESSYSPTLYWRRRVNQIPDELEMLYDECNTMFKIIFDDVVIGKTLSL